MKYPMTITFGKPVSFFAAWQAYEHGFGILSLVTDAAKYKDRSAAPAWFEAREIRGKWRVLKGPSGDKFNVDEQGNLTRMGEDAK